MPLGKEAGLGAGDIVLDRDPASPKEGHSPHFSAHVYCGQTVAHLSYCWALVRFCYQNDLRIDCYSLLTHVNCVVSYVVKLSVFDILSRFGVFPTQGYNIVNV